MFNGWLVSHLKWLECLHSLELKYVLHIAYPIALTTWLSYPLILEGTNFSICDLKLIIILFKQKSDTARLNSFLLRIMIPMKLSYKNVF